MVSTVARGANIRTVARTSGPRSALAVTAGAFAEPARVSSAIDAVVPVRACCCLAVAGTCAGQRDSTFGIGDGRAAFANCIVGALAY